MKSKWLVFSILGLLLIGFGLSLLGEAIIIKYSSQSYFWIGTLSLIIINSGLCFLGKGIICKTMIELKIN
tara:strand:- start:750 stop:959 length:210 start_codon:yes stop_codon:yes gene_type:complete